MSGSLFELPAARGLDGPAIARVLARAAEIELDWTDEVVAALTDTEGRGLLTTVERPGDPPLRQLLLERAPELLQHREIVARGAADGHAFDAR